MTDWRRNQELLFKGDWKQVDFNVAALLDDVAQVKERDNRIRQMIGSSAERCAAGSEEAG